MALKVLLHHSHEELFGTAATIEQLREELAPYCADRVILLCSYLNFIHEWLQFQPDPRYGSLLVGSAFPLNMTEILLREQRPVFHRRQCLLIAKEAARYSVGTIDPTILPGLGNFGKVFLMANDLFYRDINAVSLDEERGKLLVNWLGLVEYLNSPLKDALVRSDRIVSIVENSNQNKYGIDIAGFFERSAGIPPRIYRSFCIGFLSFYIRITTQKQFVLSSGHVNWLDCCESMKVPQNWFDSTSLSTQERQKCESVTVADKTQVTEFLKSYDQGLEDFTVFRSYPLIKGASFVAMLDSAFLVEKCETGLFWKVHEGLTSKQKTLALSIWGDVVERYVNWLLSSNSRPGINEIFPNPLYATGEEISDTAVRCDQSLALIECKGGFFSAPAKYSGDPETLNNQIRMKLVENSEKKPKGVQQLANAINSLFSFRTKTASAFDVSSVTTVFPILVVRDDIGAAPVINITLAKEFEAKLDRGNMNVEVKPLVVFSVRVLEHICRFLSDVSLTDIVEARIAADPHLLAPFWLVQNEVLDRIGDAKNERVDKEFRRIVLEIANTLFLKGKLPSDVDS